MDEDVTTLTDEELDQRLAGLTEEPEEEVTEAPAEETPTEEAPAEPQTEEPEPEEKEVEEERPPSRREQLRIQQILAKRQQADRPQQPAPTQSEALNYRDELDADPEVIERLEQDRRAEADRRYQEGMSAATDRLAFSEFRTNIRLDYPLVKDKLERLDPQSRESLDQEYLAITGYDPENQRVGNPAIGYAEYVEARLEQAQRLAEQLAAETQQNVRKQAAQTGLRPDGSSAKSLNLNKPIHLMTDEELEAYGDKHGFNPTKK